MEVEWPKMLMFLAVSFIFTSRISRSTRGAFHWRKPVRCPKGWGSWIQMTPEYGKIRTASRPSTLGNRAVGDWWSKDGEMRLEIPERNDVQSKFEEEYHLQVGDLWTSHFHHTMMLGYLLLDLLVPWLDLFNLFTLLVELKIKFKTWLRSSPLSPKLWCFFWKSFWSCGPSRLGQLWSAMVSCRIRLPAYQQVMTTSFELVPASPMCTVNTRAKAPGWLMILGYV